MGLIYMKAKKHFLENNPVLTCFLVIYVVIIASYSIKTSLYITLLLTFILVTTKMIFLINKSFFNNLIAFNLNVLYISTYITLILMISNVLYPNHLKMLIPVAILLIYGYMISGNLGIKNKNDKLVFCLFDGIIFFIISCIYTLIISFLNIFYANFPNTNTSILALALITLFLNFIRIKFEAYLKKDKNI